MGRENSLDAVVPSRCRPPAQEIGMRIGVEQILQMGACGDPKKPAGSATDRVSVARFSGGEEGCI